MSQKNCGQWSYQDCSNWIVFSLDLDTLHSALGSDAVKKVSQRELVLLSYKINCFNNLIAPDASLQSSCTQLPTPYFGSALHALSRGIHRPIQRFHLYTHTVFKASTCNKTDHLMWKGNNVPENGFRCCANFSFGKMLPEICIVIYFWWFEIHSFWVIRVTTCKGH